MLISTKEGSAAAFPFTIKIKQRTNPFLLCTPFLLFIKTTAFPPVFPIHSIKEMEVELGLKLTRVADEFTSDFQIAKDRSGTLFLSRETDTMFTLTSHLKGYKRRNIKININEDGTLIAISGEKQVTETVMVGWKVYKKEAEVKGFKKVFRIPDGVILDKITASFNEDESTLTITMPKKVKGIRGVSIEEKQEEIVKEGSGSLQIVDEQSQPRTREDNVDDHMPSQVVENDDDDDGIVENQERGNDTRDIIEPQQETNQLLKQEEENNNKVNDICDEVEEGHIESPEEAGEAEAGREHEGEHKAREKRCKMCIPIVAGSTLLLSFVVFVIHIMRSKNQTSRKKD